jgi:murein DD-endopeptidase MepM/ murein hydrolase activator NlpD
MKNNFFLFLLFLISSCASFPTNKESKNCLFPVNNHYPGGLINHTFEYSDQDLENKLRVGDLKFSVCRSDDSSVNILVPIPLSYKENLIKLTFQDNLISSIDIEDKFYRESRIEIQNRNLVSPPSSMQDRIREEYQQGMIAKNTYTQVGLTQATMGLPLKGITSSEFGVRRFINGQPRNRHIGLDIAAAEGTPVKAPMKGKVILSGNFFYKGNVIYIDHGDGLVSSYSHLSNKAINLNQIVSKGEVVGYVGSTGRVTGPHLHWEVFFLGIPINPEIFISK